MSKEPVNRDARQDAKERAQELRQAAAKEQPKPSGARLERKPVDPTGTRPSYDDRKPVDEVWIDPTGTRSWSDPKPSTEVWVDPTGTRGWTEAKPEAPAPTPPPIITPRAEPAVPAIDMVTRGGGGILGAIGGLIGGNAGGATYNTADDGGRGGFQLPDSGGISIPGVIDVGWGDGDVDVGWGNGPDPQLPTAPENPRGDITDGPIASPKPDTDTWWGWFVNAPTGIGWLDARNSRHVVRPVLAVVAGALAVAVPGAAWWWTTADVSAVAKAKK